MPLTQSSSASPTSPSPVTSVATGRAQEPSKMEHKRGPGRRLDPTALSSSASSSSSSSSPPRRPHATHSHPPSHPRSLRLHVGVFSKRKGVRYNADGRVIKCRFCEILRDRDEPFLYEDESLVIFRPLHPIVPSHILIVPRAHIRNVNQLNVDHVALLRRMRAVADRVLHTHPDLRPLDQPQSINHRTKTNPHSPTDVSGANDCPGLALADLEEEAVDGSDTDCRFAFHVPPFNSIDHVHMHAFRGETGYFGRIKYRTESWWCRSYDEVLARLEHQQQHPQNDVPLGHPRPLVPPPSAPVVCSQ